MAGRPVKVLVADTGCNPDNAITHARRLVHAEKVHFIIGPLCGHEGPAVAQVSRETGVPVLVSIAGADVEVAADEEAGVVRIEARVHAIERTGVEMEAMTAACAAALTVYDMMKRHDRGMELVSLRLVKKSGGRSGEWLRQGEELHETAPAPTRASKKAAK